MPIPLIVKEALFTVGKTALIAGATALGTFMVKRGHEEATRRGIKIPILDDEGNAEMPPLIEIIHD